MIKFNEIKDNRITRTIIGLPSSADITGYLPVKDFIDSKIILYEDCDNGVMFIRDAGYTKISNLIEQGVSGFDNGTGDLPASLSRSIKFNDLIFNDNKNI